MNTDLPAVRRDDVLPQILAGTFTPNIGRTKGPEPSEDLSCA
jgi:hypothetical protein